MLHDRNGNTMSGSMLRDDSVQLRERSRALRAKSRSLLKRVRSAKELPAPRTAAPQR